MAVPDYQSFMRPLLQSVQDGQTHKMRDLYAQLAQTFALTDTDLSQMLPSGRQATYINRIGWAKTYLLKAGALESSQRATIRITTRGLKLMQEHPEAVSTKLLMAFPEFAQFQGVQTETASTQLLVVTEATEAVNLSPEEQLDTLFHSVNDALAEELLAQVMQLTPAQFEVLVVQLLVAMGYGGSSRDAGEALGKTGDNGIDGVVKQDPLGLDKIYLQAKRWQNSVGSPEIRNFAGSLSYHKASKGVFITTSEFSASARSTAQQIGNIILIDGPQLARLMIEYGVGVLTRTVYQLKRIDADFFDEI